MTNTPNRREYKTLKQRERRAKIYYERDKQYITKVVKDYRKGLRKAVIAEKYGITKHRVTRIIGLSTPKSTESL